MEAKQKNLVAELVYSSDDKWLTRKQVKTQFHISFPSILKYEKEGIIKGYRIGRRVLFDRNQIESSLILRKFS